MLKEVIRVGLERLDLYEKKRYQSALCCHVSTHREVGHLEVKSRRVFTRNQIDQNLDLGLPSLQSCEKIHFYCLSLRICDMLLGQPNLIGVPSETNIGFLTSRKVRSKVGIAVRTKLW